MSRKVLFLAAILWTTLSACGGEGAAKPGSELQILATTSIVADVVGRVGGEHVTLTTLLPLGTDPHTFEPRPQDAAALADAGLVFANGAGLEEFLEPLLESAGAIEKLVEVSAGIELLPFQGGDAHAGEEEHEHEGGDPHTWMDPNNVILWTENIAAALAAADPGHAADYRANADAYAAELRDLDAWIRAEVAQVPEANRLIVADHAVFGYFAGEYGLTQLGTITGSFSTGASPSARDLAALEDEILQYGVRAILVGETANQDLARQVAADTGIRVVTVFHASLSGPGGPAASYIDMMRYNVGAIVEALK